MYSKVAACAFATCKGRGTNFLCRPERNEKERNLEKFRVRESACEKSTNTDAHILTEDRKR